MAPGNVSAIAARLLVASAACALLSGCFHPHHRAHRGGHEAHAEHDHGGPPPWAPAHGHRRKHEAHHDNAHGSHSGDVKVVFDSERGVYVVIGFPDHYYDAGHYYRLDSGRWQVSAGFEGPWLGIEATKVPATLRHASKKPKKAKKNKKHGNPASWAQ